MTIRFLLMAAGLGQLALAGYILSFHICFGLLSLLAPDWILRLVEQGLKRAGHPISRHVWIGRAWTIFWLALPLPILFHRPFLAAVVWPLLG
jgi:hypothetical protein